MIFFYKFFYGLLKYIFFVYIKIPKTLSAKYYQENRKALQKKLVKDIKIFLKKKRKKNSNMVVNVTKVSQKVKNNRWNLKKTFEFSVSWSIRNFPRMDFFYFLSLEWKSQGFIWESIRKAFFWRNYNNFFHIRTRMLHFPKYKECFLNIFLI